MMAATTPTAPSTMSNRVMIPVIMEPHPMGIFFEKEKESEWAKVKSINETSQLKDKVVVGDYLERINYMDVKGWSLNDIRDLAVELCNEGLPICLFLLRKREEAIHIAPSAAMTKRAAVTELITPPAKKLKETPNQKHDKSRSNEYLTAVELRQRLENDSEHGTMSNRARLFVKETLVRAYELYTSLHTMKEILETNHDVKSNPSLVNHFADSIQEFKAETENILSISEDLLVPWELHLLQLIKYMIATGETSVTKCKGDNELLGGWIQRQRQRRNSYERDPSSLGEHCEKVLKEDIAILDRIGFVWKAREFKKFDDYFEELKAYKEKHGNVKVPKLLEGSNLGEWVSKMRREYDDFSHGKKVASLNSERIEALNGLGMIWKIRYGRPRKGDARFRLRRKSDAHAEKQDENGDNTNVMNETDVFEHDMSDDEDKRNNAAEIDVERHVITSESGDTTTTLTPGEVGQDSTDADLDRQVNGTAWV